jgi:peptidoglycan/LPS O-acetylase OafA/YrhL
MLMSPATPVAPAPEIVRTQVHIPGLDGLRGVAIILVMLFHLTYFQPARTLDRVFLRLTNYGWTGVDLFFVLSGFLITGILLEAKGAPNYFRNFYARRALRIFPLYYAFVLFLIFIYPLAGTQFRAERHVLIENQWWVWTYTVNWLVALTGDFSRTPLGTAGFWSLAIEEQYYLLWPAIVLLLSRRSLLRVCISVALFSIVLRFVMAYTGFGWAAINMVTFARFDALALGGALAILARSPPGLVPLRKYAWIATVLALAGLAVIDLVSIRWYHTNGQRVTAMQLALLPLLWVSSVVLTQTAAPSSYIAKFTSARLLRTFGKYSYSLYLFHGHLVLFPQGMGYRIRSQWVPKVFGSVLPAQICYLFITFVVCLGLSWLSWNLLENQFLKLKRFFPSGSAAMRQTKPGAETRP